MFIGMTPETYSWAVGFKNNIDQNCIGYYLHSTAFYQVALGMLLCKCSPETQQINGSKVISFVLIGIYL